MSLDAHAPSLQQSQSIEVIEEQLKCSLQASSLGTLLVGREKDGELATTSLEFEFHLQFPCGSALTEPSDFHQLAQNGNEHEGKQTLKNPYQGY